MIVSDAAVSRGDIMRRLAELEQKVKELQSGRRLEATTLGRGGVVVRGGNIRVTEKGQIIVEAEPGDNIIRLGRVPFGDDPEAEKPGLVSFRTRRDGKTVAMSLFDGIFAVWDRTENPVMHTDEAAGRGLARPYLTIALGENSPPTATTSSATFETLCEGLGAIQHPVLYAYLLVRSSDASTAGEVRLMVGSTQQGPTLTVPAGQFAFRTLGPFKHTVQEPVGWVHNIRVEGRRTSGSGTIGARVMSLLGLESGFA